MVMAPEWLVNEFIKKMPVKKIQIGAEGLNQKLFAILRKQDREINYIQRFIICFGLMCAGFKNCVKISSRSNGTGKVSKVSLKSNKPFRRSCAYKVHGRTDEWTDGQGD
jgi:hypothetical protein